MKKTIFVIAAILITAAAYAGGGTASMYPTVLTLPIYHPVLEITYKPAAGVFNSGALAVQMNQTFTPAPSTVTASDGVVSAYIMAGGVTVSVVPAASFAIDGYAVTINSISLNTDQYVKITYGNAGGGGLYLMGGTGKYFFNVLEKTSYTGSFAPLGSQPFIYVSNMLIDKSCSAPVIRAGDTFTYTIAYLNNDAGNLMDGISLWDTIPQGISFIGSVPAPSLSIGKMYAWNLGTLNASGGGQVLIMALGNTGLAYYGLTSVNTASVSAQSPASSTNFMSFSRATDVQGMILQINIVAVPDVVVLGGNITVLMNVSNGGNLAGTSVSPSVMNPVSSGGGNAILAAGPAPSSISLLAGNTSGTFTWIFHASAAGTVNFSSHVYADENSQAWMSNYISSNNVTVVLPTPTSTRTSTNTPAPTITNTTVPPTATAIVPTNTQVVIVPTNTPVVVEPTDTPVIIPTSVSGEKVFTDKNFIKQNTGDRIRVYYEVPGAGKLEITVFNLSGEKIRYFTRDYTVKKYDYMDWDGKNQAMKPAGKGVYFINVKMGKWQHMKKVVILK